MVEVANTPAVTEAGFNAVAESVYPVGGGMATSCVLPPQPLRSSRSALRPRIIIENNERRRRPIMESYLCGRDPADFRVMSQFAGISLDTHVETAASAVPPSEAR
jgi:hypothetical protein